MNIWRSKQQGHRADHRITAKYFAQVSCHLPRLARVQAMYRHPTQHPHDIIETAGEAPSFGAPRPAFSSIREFSSPAGHGHSSVTGRYINILNISMLENEHD
ncbi:hypothetical protein [Bradyrhizobium sp. SYSU BS000235]|jgi:hypothetical protein|uniref:hypothetical protein n=1 Tax=Bradyrhizobium sp. SYSU BS000235 TaxID=3411332 RepID=UPI003C708BEF